MSVRDVFYLGTNFLPRISSVYLLVNDAMKGNMISECSVVFYT